VYVISVDEMNSSKGSVAPSPSAAAAFAPACGGRPLAFFLMMAMRFLRCEEKPSSFL
jgi:hypothetical protein